MVTRTARCNFSEEDKGEIDNGSADDGFYGPWFRGGFGDRAHFVLDRLGGDRVALLTFPRQPGDQHPNLSVIQALLKWGHGAVSPVGDPLSINAPSLPP